MHVCAGMCAHVRGCTRVLNITHVFAGVCQWKKLGQASRGECQSKIFIYFILIVILYVPS